MILFFAICWIFSRPWVGLNHQPFHKQPNELANCATESYSNCNDVTMHIRLNPRERKIVYWAWQRLSKRWKKTEHGNDFTYFTRKGTRWFRAWLAQTVEHETLNLGVGDSFPPLGETFCMTFAFTKCKKKFISFNWTHLWKINEAYNGFHILGVITSA